MPIKIYSAFVFTSHHQNCCIFSLNQNIIVHVCCPQLHLEYLLHGKLCAFCTFNYPINELGVIINKKLDAINKDPPFIDESKRTINKNERNINKA